MRDTFAMTLVVTAIAACGPPGAPDTPAPKPTTSASATSSNQTSEAAPTVLHGDISRYKLDDNPELRARLMRSPYGYFRFTNLRFANAVCKRFADAKASMPLVNLHGDAHLEQYAVTSEGRGLADYDDASTGPAVLDLVRFGVSLELAARERKWDGHKAVASFIAGYRAALEQPKAEAPIPAYVTRTKASFKEDRAEFLNDCETLMEPPAPEEAETFETAFSRYVKLMKGLHPELPEHFFKLKKYGRLRSGVGSALSQKYVARVEGETDAPDDDVVLEAKELRDLTGVTCVTASVGGGAFRILLGQTRIGGQPMRFLAQVPRGEGESLSDQPFWVQAWLDNYNELSIEDPKLTEQDLLEISRDVGSQLGRGHVSKIADPITPQLRAAQLQMLSELSKRLHASIDELTEITLASWKQFVGELSQ